MSPNMKQAILQDKFTSVLQVGTRDELLREVVRFARGLGFQTAGALAVVDHVQSESEFLWVNNAPPAALCEFAGKADYGRRDPVMQHCKRVGVPIIWNQCTYTAAGEGALWEAQARFGFHAGIALALHLPKGRHFFMSVDRDQPLPACSVEVTRMVAELQLFAVLAQDAAMGVLVPLPTVNSPDLTPREHECLCWTMEGKTAWEVGCILGISEQTAARHLNNAMHKLGCVNKHHAVVKALRLGLIR